MFWCEINKFLKQFYRILCYLSLKHHDKRYQNNFIENFEEQLVDFPLDTYKNATIYHKYLFVYNVINYTLKSISLQGITNYRYWSSLANLILFLKKISSIIHFTYIFLSTPYVQYTFQKLYKRSQFLLNMHSLVWAQVAK